MDAHNTYISPFFVYILSFITLFVFYILHWSTLYPKMSISLLIFILGTSFVMLLMGFYFYRKKFFIYYPSKSSPEKLIKWTKYYLLANLVEILYSRHIPLLNGLRGEELPDDVNFFGIPMFHILVLSFGAFLSLMIFHKMRSDKSTRRRMLPYFALSFLAPIIIYGRGILFMTLTGCFFIYLMSLSRIRKKILFCIFLGMTLLFVFGVLGDVRIGASDSRFVNRKNGVSITVLGEATQQFQDSWIPHEYMWGYIYAISPIGNLQYNINEHDDVSPTLSSLFELCSMEMFSETVSKRLVSFEKRQEDLVIPPLNVSTIYARPYLIMGWWGMILIFFYTIIYIIVVFMIISPSSEYFVVSIAIVNVIISYNLFNNMFAYGGYANVIFIPLVLNIGEFVKRLKKSVYD